MRPSAIWVGDDGRGKAIKIRDGIVDGEWVMELGGFNLSRSMGSAI